MPNIILLATVLLAGFVSGLAGFGFGLVLMGILPYLLSIRVIAPLATLYIPLVFLATFIPVRKHLDWKVLLPVLVGAAVGVPLGVWGLASFPEVLIKRVLGVAILAICAYELLLGKRQVARLRPAWGLPIGLFTGSLTGAFATGGPPVMIYLTARSESRFAIKAAASAYFIVASLYKVPFLWIHRLLTWEVIRLALFLAPAAAAGVAAGMLLFRKVSNEIFRIVVLCLLSVSGLMLVIGAGPAGV